MNYRFLLSMLVLLTIIPSFLTAQTVKVVDETTLKPIANVYIYNNGRDKMASTNTGGTADLGRFSPEDTLNFQHPGFKRFSITYERLEARSFEVELTERAVYMDEIFVTASKRQQRQDEIPQRITRIDKREVQFKNPQTSADLLQSSGKVFVQKSQLGGGSPMMRGFAANSVLIAVDGVRMNNAIFRGGNLQNVLSVDPHALQSTELLFGPGSIIYGSDAVGGVMNFRTKTPTLSYSDGESLITGNAVARYSSANHEQTFHADVNIGRKDWGALTSVSYSYFDDLRSGDDFYEEFPDFGKRTHYVARRGGEDVVLD